MGAFCIYYRDRSGRDCKAVIRGARTTAQAVRVFKKRYRRFVVVITTITRM